MAQYDLHLARGGGYYVDVQSDLVGRLETTIVAPLMPRADAPVAGERLNPVLAIDGVDHVLVTQFIAAVPRAALGRPHGTVAHRADEITRALDTLLTGW